MQEQSQYINDLQNHRYSITTICNDSHFKVITSTSVAASSFLEQPEVNLTYHDLDLRLQTYLGLTDADAKATATAKQQLRNYRSTLAGFLASVGKTNDSRVGAELTTKFDESLANYIGLLDLADSTKRDRRSHLNRYRELFGAEKPARKTTTLSETLRAAIARKGVAPKTLARSIGISTSAIQRYLAGAIPNQRGIPSLRRLEAALGFERDSLTSLVKDHNECEDTRAPYDAGYRKRLAERTADPYYLPVSAIGSALEKEWLQLLNYKTAIAPTLERTSRGVWRCVPAESASLDSPLVKVGKTVCPTAQIGLDRLRGFLGYLARPADAGGQGVPAEAVQTLAWLAVPSAVTGYLEFLTQRSEGLIHAGQQGVARFVASLVRAKTGYLRQRPEFRNALPEDVRPQTEAEWDTLCDATHKLAQQWIVSAKDMSREPDSPIAGLLALDHPLEPVIVAVERITQLAAKAPSGSLSQARHHRDALLIAFVTSNPLRARTLKSLTWSPDNAGTLYQTPEGWRIRLTRSMLKNGDGKAGKRYDVAVAPRVGELIDAYIEEYRATLLGDTTSPYFFVNNRNAKPWKEMSRHVWKLTQRHVPGTHGFSLHAFRHLVATDLLKRNPNAFVTAAVLLNDALETVMRSYAHLQRDDSFLTHHQYLESIRNSRK
ncbi:MAG: hypothetical protein FHP92_16925 [Denitromonas halophila]|nr:MAG: hypothetical protein FHP92_16925 [Denitromonas halophila]